MAALVIAVQCVTTVTDTEFYLTQIIMSACYSLVAVGLCLLMGYAGQISLGHAAFFAIGGYSSAALTTWDLSSISARPLISFLIKSRFVLQESNSWGQAIAYVNPWISLCVGVGVAAGVAWCIGTPILKLRGHYLAMATLGFGTIIYRIALGTRIFGEADGISEVPSFPLPFGMSLDGARIHRIQSYYVVWIVVFIFVIMIGNLIHSRAGRALRALHGNEEAAQAMGVDTARFKLNLFVLSAIMAALAGVILTHYNGGIGPSEAGVMKSVRYVAIVAVGGMANLWGSLLSSMILNFLSLRGYFGSFDDAVFGTVLVLMMLFAPDGILKKKMQRNALRKN